MPLGLVIGWLMPMLPWLTPMLPWLTPMLPWLTPMLPGLAIATELLTPRAAMAATAISDLRNIADSPFYRLRFVRNARMPEKVPSANRQNRVPDAVLLLATSRAHA